MIRPVARLAAAIIFCPFMSKNTSIRALRATWCLNQEELADLLGISQSRISRYEKNEEVPALGTLLGFHVIFNCPLPRMFANQYRLVEDTVMGRAAELEARIREKSDYSSSRKRHLLEAMMARATSRTDV